MIEFLFEKIGLTRKSTDTGEFDKKRMCNDYFLSALTPICWRQKIN